jgi:hypothetical protein
VYLPIASPCTEIIPPEGHYARIPNAITFLHTLEHLKQIECEYQAIFRASQHYVTLGSESMICEMEVRGLP